MHITREFLLKQAYGLYLQKGYSNVSISTLQNELNIGRASLYYHFRTKDDLFKAVLEEYVFAIMRQGLENVQNKPLSVPFLINSLINVFSQIENRILSYETPVDMSKFIELIMTAYLKYSDIAHFLQIVNRKVYRLWVKALQHEQQMGNIKKDINVMIMASFFCDIKSAYESGTQQYYKKRPDKESSAYKDSLNYLYELIKTKHENKD